jgi:intermembrane space import and assembly protein 40
MAEKDIIIEDAIEVDEPKAASTEDSPAEAYDPETGEINWDCPCLGPMVKPPCGEKFKEAFSCFVHSTEEPKGSDCVALFREMQVRFNSYITQGLFSAISRNIWCR